MGELIARTLPLAIGGAISPILLISVVLVLSGEHKPRQRALAFAIGSIAGLVVLTVLVATLFHSVGHTGTGPTTAGSVIDITLGVLLTVFGLGRLAELAYRGSRRDPADPVPAADDTPPAADHGGVARSLALGFALMATNVTTLALYLAALKDVAEAKVDDLARFVTIAVVIAVIMVPVVVPLLLTVVVPREAKRILAAVRSFVTRYRSLITGIFVTVFGAYLLVKGAGGT